MDDATAYLELTEHRHYQYRGCAPVPSDIADFPGQALGDPELSIDAWSTPDRAEDDLEPQKARLARERRATAACGRCPVLAECRAYANSTTPGGGLAEPDGIWGGQLAGARRRAHTGPVVVVRGRIPVGASTAQKTAVLRSLAAHTDPHKVAAGAGMDLRTANWHRSKLTTLLGLNRATATRGDLLEAAAQVGLLEGVEVVPCDGTVPAVPPPGPAAAATPEPVAGPRAVPARAAGRKRPSSRRSAKSRTAPVRTAAARRRVRAVKPAGQLALDVLIPAAPERLERVA